MTEILFARQDDLDDAYTDTLANKVAAEAAQAAAEAAQAAAETHETNAETAETNAEAAQTAAEAAQTAAEAAQTGAESAYDSFDDRYLGEKSSEPAVDNDGNALVAGALFFHTGVGMKVWGGSSWSVVPGLSNLVEDTTPQFGANVDMNGFGIIFPGATVTDVTGADTKLVSGTAGTSGNLSEWNADGDLVDAGAAIGDYTPTADLASNDNAKGAALIGIEDSGTLITATTVEGALAENRAAIDTIESDYLISSDIGSSVQAYDADTAKLDVSQSWTATQNLQDNILQRPSLKDYGELVNAIGDFGGGTQDIDLEAGNVVSATISTAESTFTFSNPPATGTEGGFKLYLTNGGSQTVNWPAEVDWAGGSAPSLTAAGVDVLVFTTIDGGTIWYGFAAGLDMQ